MGSDNLNKSVVCLTVFVVINTIAVVVVTLVQCNNIRNLEIADADLQSDIDDVLSVGGYDNQEPIVELASALRRQVENVRPSGKTKRSGIGDLFMSLLKAQESVIERHCKDKTKICKQGEKGIKGPMGDKGLKGDPGPQGPSGVQGVQGTKGAKGPTGPTGDAGVKGAPGAPGSQGIAGAIGDKGTAGAKGVAGPKGEPGNPGIRGDSGESGRPGATGLPGPRGDRGPKGAKGDRGNPGGRGARGDPGQRGPDRDKLGVGCECLKKPTIAGPPNEIRHVAYGSPVTMTCNADGIPPPKITWNTRTQGSVLSIPKVTSFDYITYECTASNVFGTDTKNITLAH